MVVEGQDGRLGYEQALLLSSLLSHTQPRHGRSGLMLGA